jgi:urease accessory protein UreE
MSEKSYKRKAFKAGDDVAIRLPKAYGLEPGDALKIKFDGHKYLVFPERWQNAETPQD